MRQGICAQSGFYSGQPTGQTSIGYTRDGLTEPLASNIRYFPFGPLKSLQYGNGLSLDQSREIKGAVCLKKDINPVFEIFQVSGAFELMFTSNKEWQDGTITKECGTGIAPEC